MKLKMMHVNIPIRKQTLRLILGALAFILPIILPLALFLSGSDQAFLHSISSYYYSEVRFLFLAILILFGLAFILYGPASSYRMILIVTGTLSLLLAIFPTYDPAVTEPSLSGHFHIACAIALFALLGWTLRGAFNLPLRFPMLSKISVWIWIVLGVLVVYFLAFRHLWPHLVLILETAILWLFALGLWIRNKINNKLAK